MKKYIDLVESVIANGGRVRQHTVFDHLPKNLVAKTDELAESEGIARAAALYLVLHTLNRPVCACGKPVPMVMWPRRLRSACSSKCAGLDPTTDLKRQATNLHKYGVAYVRQDPTIAKKQKRTMLKRYGVTATAASPELKAKMRATLLRNHGVTETFLSKEVKAKTRKTMIERYGVEHNQQNRELFERQQVSGFKIKQCCVQGKTFRLRGYEPQVVAHLVNKVGIKAKNILFTAAEGVPAVKYQVKGKTHYYHPDLMIRTKTRNVLVEVKSTFTAGILKRQIQGSGFQRLKTKLKACVSAGWEVRCCIVDTKGKVVLIKDAHLKTRKQVREEFEAALLA
jgi:hypothetical protein